MSGINTGVNNVDLKTNYNQSQKTMENNNALMEEMDMSIDENAETFDSLRDSIYTNKTDALNGENNVTISDKNVDYWTDDNLRFTPAEDGSGAILIEQLDSNGNWVGMGWTTEEAYNNYVDAVNKVMIKNDSMGDYVITKNDDGTYEKRYNNYTIQFDADGNAISAVDNNTGILITDQGTLEKYTTEEQSNNQPSGMGSDPRYDGAITNAEQQQKPIVDNDNSSRYDGAITNAEQQIKDKEAPITNAEQTFSADNFKVDL